MIVEAFGQNSGQGGNQLGNTMPLTHLTSAEPADVPCLATISAVNPYESEAPFENRGSQEDHFQKSSYGESGNLILGAEDIPSYQKLVALRRSFDQKSTIRDHDSVDRPVSQQTPLAAVPEDKDLRAHPAQISKKNLKWAVSKAVPNSAMLFSWMKHGIKSLNLRNKEKERMAAAAAAAAAAEPIEEIEPHDEKLDIELRAMVDMIIDMQTAHDLSFLRVDWMRCMIKSAVKLQRTWRSYCKRVYWKQLVISLGGNGNSEDTMLKRNEWGGWELMPKVKHVVEKPEKLIVGGEDGACCGDDCKHSAGLAEAYLDSLGAASSDEEEHDESLAPEERERIRAERKEARAAQKAGKELRQERLAACTSPCAHVRRAARKALELKFEQAKAEEAKRRIVAGREAARQAALLQAGIASPARKAAKEGPHERASQIHRPRINPGLQDEALQDRKPEKSVMRPLSPVQASDHKSTQGVQATPPAKVQTGMSSNDGTETEAYLQTTLEEIIKNASVNPADRENSPFLRPVSKGAMQIHHRPRTTQTLQDHASRERPQEIGMGPLSHAQANDQSIQATPVEFPTGVVLDSVTEEPEAPLQKTIEEGVKNAPLTAADRGISPRKVEQDLMRPVCPSKQAALQIHRPRTNHGLQDRGLQVKPKEIVMGSLIVAQVSDRKPSQGVQATPVKFQKRFSMNGVTEEADASLLKTFEEGAGNAPLNQAEREISPRKVEPGLLRPVFPSKSPDRAVGSPISRHHPSNSRRPGLEIWSSDLGSVAKEAPLSVQGNFKRLESGAHLSVGERRLTQSEGHNASRIGSRRATCSSLTPPPLACVPANISNGCPEPLELTAPATSREMPSRRMTTDCQLLPEIRASTAVPRDQGGERPAVMRHSGSMPSFQSALQPKLKGRGLRVSNSFNAAGAQPMHKQAREPRFSNLHGASPKLDILLTPPMTAMGQRRGSTRMSIG